MTAPSWCRPAAPERWPVTVWQLADMDIELAVPSGWERAEHAASQGWSECSWQGARIGEWLNVAHLERASDSVSVSDWPHSLAALTGVSFATDPRGPVPELVDDPIVDSSAELAAHFGVHEVTASTGLAIIDGSPSLLVRWYDVAARYQGSAWKVTIGFHTACLAGSPEQLVEQNDHVRAAATLGSVRFGAPSGR